MPVTLRPTTFDDIHDIMQWVNEPDVLAQFANFKRVTFEQEAEYLLKLLKSREDFTYTILCDGVYAGQASINKIYWAAKNGRIAIFLKKEFRGSGHGEAALKLLIEKAFKVHKLRKVWLIVRAENRRAQRLYVKAGFKREALLLDEYVDPRTHRFVNMIRMCRINTKAGAER